MLLALLVNNLIPYSHSSIICYLEQEHFLVRWAGLINEFKGWGSPSTLGAQFSQGRHRVFAWNTKPHPSEFTPGVAHPSEHTPGICAPNHTPGVYLKHQTTPTRTPTIQSRHRVFAWNTKPHPSEHWQIPCTKGGVGWGVNRWRLIKTILWKVTQLGKSLIQVWVVGDEGVVGGEEKVNTDINKRRWTLRERKVNTDINRRRWTLIYLFFK